MIFAIFKTRMGDRVPSDQQLRAHEDYLAELARRDVLVVAGPFDDRIGSMLLVRAESMEEAIEFARADPLVKAALERYQVRGWSQIYDPQQRLGVSPRPPRARAEESGLLVVPPPVDGFVVVDAATDPAHAEFLVRCFASKQIPTDEPARTSYLRLARGHGLKKLLLLHDGEPAGQIEFAPPEASGLPIQGKRLTVINCLWVLDAFTCLDGARRLLAACAEASRDSDGLATIAYNSALAWLPRGFYEHQGFSVVDQLDTGRFCGDTPIAAYLMWRSLREGATPPIWNTEQLLGGVDFCPAYPWMFGRRLYRGDSFPYRARLVKEGLRRPEVVEQFPVLAVQHSNPWTLLEIGIPAADLDGAIERIQSALISEPTYYAYIYDTVGRDEMIIVYPFRDYRVTQQSDSWDEPIRYGMDKGIPREELVFAPQPLVSDPDRPD